MTSMSWTSPSGIWSVSSRSGNMMSWACTHLGRRSRCRGHLGQSPALKEPPGQHSAVCMECLLLLYDIPYLFRLYQSEEEAIHVLSEALWVACNNYQAMQQAHLHCLET